eukprot:SAG11_NODE_3625_length_2328_cov_1.659489_1_plen_82_part_00
MAAVGFSAEEQMHLYRIVAAVMLLGQVLTQNATRAVRRKPQSSATHRPNCCRWHSLLRWVTRATKSRRAWAARQRTPWHRR